MMVSVASGTSRTRSMSVGEFDIIDRYFRRPLPARDDVLVGIGDDGAVLRISAGHALVTTVATLSAAAWDASAGDPSRLGHDAMAMALNRLAAAGAQPAWATLALTLAEADTRWLAAFSDALFAVAAPLGVALIGGDTTRGPFTATVVGHGLLERDAAQTIPGIRAGDAVFVSGELGDGLLEKPTAGGAIHVTLGRWIRGHGGVAVDLSEGLGAALVSLLERDDLGASIDLTRLPLTPPVRRHLDENDAWSGLLAHRGDMQLCFTLPAGADAGIGTQPADEQIRVTRIASVNDSGVLNFATANGRTVALAAGDPGVLRA